MGRKAISNYKLKALLTEGKTSKEIATLLNISTGSVSNYRAYLKKKREITTLKKTNKPQNISEKEIKNTTLLNTDSSDAKSLESKYTYIINGTQIKFMQKPKSITIGINELIIDF
ncbi:MAG: hypothetical protein CMC19_05305 [Flavobacteriaceae bacterium]|nr:hypothetical protein [Flavobacteriaceae bacterium]